MRRSLRITFNAAVVLSLLLCVTAAGFWRRSYSVGDLFHARTDGRWFYAGVGEGRIVAGVWSRAEWNPPSLHPDHVRQTITESRTMMKVHGAGMVADARVLGIAYRRGVGSVKTTRDVEFSFGHLVALTAVLPVTKSLVMAIRPWRVRAAKARGLCHSCGYDLRATPDRCPECGAIPTEATA